MRSERQTNREANLSYEFVDAPLPTPGTRSRSLAQLYDVLARLAPGKAIDVNKIERTAKSLVFRFRKFYDVEARFVVRAVKPGWSRIWRVR